MSARRCPRCQAIYAAPARFCSRDGSPLVDVAGSAPTPPRRTDPRPMAPPGAPDRASTLTNHVLDGRYDIQRKLGEGGMSYVYLGRDRQSEATVAIKVLSPKLSGDPSSVERLRREAGLAMRLDHPNVCRIFRLGESSDGLIYLVMPYLQGEILSDREARIGVLSVEEGLPLLIQMCQGLQHAHDLHIIHRDLKPENVMIVPDAEAPGGIKAVVMDFGLAKERVTGPEVRKLTATGIVLGTPEFMSPEQIRGKPLDSRSDIYSLGILAFEMFTGKLPFDGRTAQEMMIARLRGQPRAIRSLRPDLPASLETAVTKSLAIEPSERYPSMRAFAEALVGSADSGMRKFFSR